MFRRLPLIAAVLAGAVLLAGCQTTGSTSNGGAAVSAPPPATQQVAVDYSGTWTGTFTNRQGTSFPITFWLTVENGRVTGRGSIPSSSVDANPTLTGTVTGNRIVFTTSSGFVYTLTANAAGNTLTGQAAATNFGIIRLSR
jgi:hypothetical protein